jgi:hypothetical protein
MVSTTLPDLDQLDIEALKVLIVERHELLVETLSSQTQQIEHLKLVIEKLRRMMFGSKSEKVTIQVEQFELQLEETETEQAVAGENTAASVSEDKPRSKSRPSRKPGSPATGLRRWGGSRFPLIFPAKLFGMSQGRITVQIATAPCAFSAKT